VLDRIINPSTKNIYLLTFLTCLSVRLSRSEITQKSLDKMLNYQYRQLESIVRIMLGSTDCEERVR